MTPYKFKILSVDPTENYYRVRFVDPDTVSECRTPAWAMGVAESVSKGSKVVMCVVNGRWNIQSVLITRKFHKTPAARRLSLNIARKIGGSNKTVPKKWAGGNINGPSHEEGGVAIEVEGGEGVIMKEVMTDPRYKVYSGTNREIVHEMQMEHGGNPMMKKGGEVKDLWMQAAEEEMEKKGTIGKFTKKALRHQMTPVDYAKEVLENPESHRETTRREAQFVKNANPEKFADGGTITPRKEVSASMRKSIEEVLTLPQYSNLKPLEAGMLYGKFKEYENMEIIGGEPFHEIEYTYQDKPGLEEAMFEKLSEKDYIDQYDLGASLTDSGYKFIDAVNGRLQTRKLVKMGSDLFPEESGIPEMIRKADKDKDISERELKKLARKVDQTNPVFKRSAVKIKNEIKEVMDKRSDRALIQDKALKAMHPGKRISSTGRIYWESRPNRSDIDLRKRMKMGGIYKNGGDTSYEGWKNYPTWVVKLWLDNDEGTQDYWTERTKEIYQTSKKSQILSKREEARFALAQELKEQIEEGNPLSEQASMYSDLLGASIGLVYWDEIAETYLEEMEG